MKIDQRNLDTEV